MIKKHYYSWQDNEAMCTNIVKQMYKDDFMPDYILGITRGGNIPATIISNMLDIPCEAMKVSFRNDDKQEDHWLSKLVSTPAPTGMEKKILIVDDINDTGATLQGIHDIVVMEGMADNVKYITLFDKLSSNFGEVEITAKELDEVEEKQWVVFPYEEWWK